jgi:hypothetical protein
MMLWVRQRWKFVRTVIRSFTIKRSFNQQCFIELVRRNTTPLYCKIRQEVISNSIFISLRHEALHHTLLGLQWLVVQHLKLHFNWMMVLTSIGKDIFIKKKEIHNDFLKWNFSHETVLSSAYIQMCCVIRRQHYRLKLIHLNSDWYIRKFCYFKFTKLVLSNIDNP